jgi:hypothetical protein
MIRPGFLPMQKYRLKKDSKQEQIALSGVSFTDNNLRIL